MKQPIRLFALGLFTASVIILIFALFINNGNKNTDNMANKDMIDTLKDRGYHVLNDADYIKLSVDDKGDKQKSEDMAKAEEDKDKDKEADKQDHHNKDKDKKDDKEKTYKLHIKNGMASSEISEKLADNDIIKDASKFSNYLHKHNYDQKVQLGKFKVSSSMTQKELAKKITK